MHEYRKKSEKQKNREIMRLHARTVSQFLFSVICCIFQRAA